MTLKMFHRYQSYNKAINLTVVIYI